MRKKGKRLVTACLLIKTF
ncbi:MAG: KxYKxGKxW signal peptide domain-containing protein [Peptococcus niger]|nr:KxYKxGKxW signal peptide domain-containing protein [Clostridiales bacterium]